MSSLYKLSIKGIRSFDPEREETIQFGFPLTLICGANGTGKTTTIECLKYACTGDLPPNSKGGAFVHDPSLSGRSQVTGQVKLAFKDTSHKSMILTRTVSLTRRKQRGSTNYTNTFKTLEGQLAIIDGPTREKVTVSSKNAELDQQTPLHLGASKAVLDYVIFCHQDESLWPLAEGSVLKKRFDDIFEASKFTKVLDNFKAIRKDMGVQIKLLEQSVEHLKVDKDRAARVRDKVDEYQSKVETLESDIIGLNSEIDRKEAAAEKLFSSNQDFQRILVEVDRLGYTKSSVADRLERVAASMSSELTEPDDELLRQEKDFAAVVDGKKAQVARLDEQRSVQTEKITGLGHEHDELVGQEAELKALEIEYNRNHSTLMELMKDQSSEMGYELATDAKEAITEFGPVFTRHFADQEQKYEKSSASMKQEIADADTRLADVVTEINREKQHQSYLDDDHRKKTDKARLLEKKVAMADTANDDLAMKRNDLARFGVLLDDSRKQFQQENFDDKINALNKEWSGIDVEIEDLNRKITTATLQAETTTKVEVLGQQLKEKQQAYDKSVERSQGETEAGLANKMAKLAGEIETEESQVAGDEARAQQTKQQLVKAKQTEATAKSAILKVLESADEIKEYEEILAELQQSHNNVMEDVNTSEVTKQFNVTAISIAESKHHCMLCKRPYDVNEPGFKSFVDALKQSVNEDKVKTIIAEADEIGRELKQMRGIQSDVLAYRQAVKEVAELEKEPEYDPEKARAALAKHKRELEKMSGLKRTVADSTRLMGEITQLKNDIAELTSDSVGGTQFSVSELQEQASKYADRAKEIRRESEKLSQQREAAKTEMGRLESKQKDIKVQISQLETSLADVLNLKSSLSELEEEIKEVAASQEKTEKALVMLQTKLEAQRVTTEDTKRKVTAALQSKQASFTKLKQAVDDYHRLSTAVARFERESMPALETSKARIAEVKQQRQQAQDEVAKFTTEIKRLESEIIDSGPMERNVHANLEHRRLSAELADVERKLEELNVDEARKSQEQFKAQSDRLREEIASLNAHHNTKLGEIKQIKDQVQHLQRELERDYADIGDRYHQEWVRLQTNMLVSNDIQVYTSSLDNAIMKYHSLKMEEINRILRELWQQTYKGSDIDTIAIKTDVHVTAKTRTYNYRVVMFKKGQELDMRGRCSAGQKVLTSILIRLALAECFGINCGIIALDEPTTNLDTENAESLARALNQIIAFRRQQSNFQLIVITHDENFLMHINGGGYTDHFYRIQRSEDETSKIYRLDMSRM
ncbi:DNA repair protein Rad50p [Diutina catenulata]